MKAISEVKTQAEAKQIAIDWQNWQSKQSLTYLEISQWQNYFETLADKFELQDEFKENAII